jgi:transcriptional regulator with XRE-family HTH domain
MGRPRVYGLDTGYPGARSYRDAHFHEWAMIVGDRVRRLRRARGWTLTELAKTVRRPDGGRYNPGYFSKLERGIGHAPLIAYLGVADALEVEPGRLLGPDDVFDEVSEAEMTLIEALREAQVAPGEAIVRVFARSHG